MSNEIGHEDPRFYFDELIEPRAASFRDGCPGEDEGSVLATILIMVICVVLSVAMVNWFIFHY